MMQLGSTTAIEVDGVAVLADHADPAQFWYLPVDVGFGKRQDGSPAFSMIKYKPAVVDAGIRGGGFLMMESVVTLPPATRSKIMGRLGALVPNGTPKLSPAPVESGTVRCLALNLEGGGGTVAAPPPPGSFNAVTKILGATRPSLTGEETAAFSLVLDQEGATIMQRAFEQGAEPVCVIYDLEYTVLTPDIRVEIAAHLDQAYTALSAGLEAQIYWVRVGLDAAFEQLRKDGAIVINVINFNSSDDRAAKEQWALDFFKNDLLAKWFEPSLDLGKVKIGEATPEGLDAVLKRLKDFRDGVTTPTTPTPTTPTTPTTPATPAATPPATLQITQTTPTPLPAGYALEMTPSTSGTTETLVVKGPIGATVTVDGAAKMLDAAGKLTVDVPAGSSHPIAVDWPAAPPVDETFRLYFTFDQPHKAGFAATSSNPVFNSYLLGTPVPPDPRFVSSTAPGRTVPPAGAAALKEWLDSKISPKSVTVGAHASFEGVSDAATTTLNKELSERRLAVVRGIIANRATITSSEALGFSRAQAAGRIRDEDDRVVEITGKVPGATTAVAIRATLARAKQPAGQPGGVTPGGATPGGATPGGTTPGANTAGGTTPALVSFRLKFVHQDERKTISVIYDRKQAVKRTYAPQGFMGLLLADLPDRAKHFVEVDLHDSFFEQLNVDIATPVDFAKIGLFSSDVAIDYGDPAVPAELRHGEFRLTTADPGPKRFSSFLNSSLDLDFQVGLQHHFDANSGWLAEKLSYDIPPRRSLDRTLKVDPADDLGFLQLEIFPNRIDAGIVDAVDVALAYDDGASFRRNDTFRVLPKDDKQFWRLRLSRPDKRSWTARFTHHLSNGTVRTSDPVTSEASFLPVDDPFPAALDIDAEPLFAPGEVRRAFLDVIYVDVPNNYRREERLEILGDATESVKLRIALLNPELRTFRHRITIVGVDGSFIQRAPVDGEETLIGIGL